MSPFRCIPHYGPTSVVGMTPSQLRKELARNTFTLEQLELMVEVITSPDSLSRISERRRTYITVKLGKTIMQKYEFASKKAERKHKGKKVSNK